MATKTATRQCLYTAMGISQKAKLRDAAAILSGKSGGGYVRDTESNGKLLRPDWTTTFANNSSWHDSMIKFMRTKVPTVVPGLILDTKNDKYLLQRIEVVFKNIAAEHRKLTKTTVNSSDADTDEDSPILTAVEEAQQNRRRTRKVRVCR